MIIVVWTESNPFSFGGRGQFTQSVFEGEGGEGTGGTGLVNSIDTSWMVQRYLG